MDILKDRIMQDGKCYPGGILKVDSFINHQMDPNLMMDCAKEFVRLFSDLNINKIVTIEASGIAPAILVGYILQLPVVFIKKKQPKTMDNSFPPWYIPLPRTGIIRYVSAIASLRIKTMSCSLMIFLPTAMRQMA